MVSFRRPSDGARRSVSRVLSRPEPGRGWPFIWDVRRRTPHATDPSGGAEGPPGGAGNADATCRSYLVLLPVGFSLPPPSPAARCALTAPFHPCRPPAANRTGTGRRYIFCGTFPGVAPAGRYPAPYLRGARTFLPLPRRSGLGRERPSDRLAWDHMGRAGAAVYAPGSKRVPISGLLWPRPGNSHTPAPPGLRSAPILASIR